MVLLLQLIQPGYYHKSIRNHPQKKKRSNYRPLSKRSRHRQRIEMYYDLDSDEDLDPNDGLSKLIRDLGA